MFYDLKFQYPEDEDENGPRNVCVLSIQLPDTAGRPRGIHYIGSTMLIYCKQMQNKITVNGQLNPHKM